jgi:hypothetical protein
VLGAVDAVVAPRLRIYRAKRRFVTGASIMPQVPGGISNAP